MTNKFSSKEIHFLKTDPDDFNFRPPELYFSDLLLTKTIQIKAFEKRLSETKIPGRNFFLKPHLIHFWIIKEVSGKI